MVITALDINIDPRCSKKIDADMALGNSSGPDIIMALMAAELTQISMASAAASPSDTNMTSNVQTPGIHITFGGNKSY